jgi:hypothetical protein
VAIKLASPTHATVRVTWLSAVLSSQ